MTPINCDQCGTTFSSKFCPECGRNRNDIVVVKPVEITTYVHGGKEDNYDLYRELGIEPDSDLGKSISYLNYEVKIVYKIEDGNFIATHVDCGDGQGLCELKPIKNENE